MRKADQLNGVYFECNVNLIAMLKIAVMIPGYMWPMQAMYITSQEEWAMVLKLEVDKPNEPEPPGSDDETIYKQCKSYTVAKIFVH